MVVHLNTANENNEWEKQQLRDAYRDEVQSIKDEYQIQIELLNNDINSKSNALQELATASISNEKEAHKRLVSSLNEANAREADLKRQHETFISLLTKQQDEEISSHVQRTQDLSLKLEEQSRQHQSHTATLRDELTKEHQARIKSVQSEMSVLHNQDIGLLKSRHEKSIVQLTADASDHEASAVEDAVAMTKLEYEQKLSHQVLHHNQKCKAIKDEVTVRLNCEIDALQLELEQAKMQASEVSSLRANIDIYKDNEKKLQSELKRLQHSLDSMTTSNQSVIAEMNETKSELVCDILKAKKCLSEQLRRIDGLEREVCRCVLK